MKELYEKFKLIIWLIIAIILFLKLDELGKNGRYVPVGETGFEILDTQNGKIYRKNNNNYGEAILNNKGLFNWIQESDNVK
jgi:hypothetical protein